MPRGHKPSKAAKNYHIHGSAGDSRAKAKVQRSATNTELRTLRCVVCRNERKPRSFPICSNCTR